MEHIRNLVIGGGVVGLAVARALAQQGEETAVLERAARPGEMASGRNSGVIHAGIYYPAGSLRATLCQRGRDLLYDYCAQVGIAHDRCGKLIVAVDDAERPALQALAENARQCGLELMTAPPALLAERAPGLQCVAALWSERTGIIDAAALMGGFIQDIEQAGSHVLPGNEFFGARTQATGFVVTLATGESLACSRLINCAGIAAAEVAHRVEGLAAAHIPVVRMARGNYFRLHAASPWTTLVYPLPDAGGLGVHSTLDLAGGTRFGPDVEWIERPDHAVNTLRRDAFIQAVRRYWPDLPADALQPDFAGIRAKADSDFRIDGPQRHGICGLANLFGIDSPGLTASLAIAEAVQRLLDES